MKCDYNKTVSFLKNKILFKPKCAIILGTGLGAIADEVEGKITIPFEEIPGFVKSTAPSHRGLLIAGRLRDVPVIILQGRFHYYEGYTMEEIVYPIRIFRLLDIKYLIVTNASGSLNRDLQPGQLVQISDHINMMGTNPLIGSNKLDSPVIIDGNPTYQFGERFPSQNAPYDRNLADLANDIAHTFNISLLQGVYCAISGPALESRAECLMIKSWGADLVGMSTVPEVIAANHCGMKVLAISVVSNLSNIFHSFPHSMEEIRRWTSKATKDLEKLINEILKKI